ncbi:hypothetical protein [Plantactinospora sonchi]|uniref:Uncharacterized protein n=1 Tax=Plantactinospora sonchi TaxID=1544735 RepID=A0ABU7S1S9_9ACTN
MCQAPEGQRRVAGTVTVAVTVFLSARLVRRIGAERRGSVIRGAVAAGS